MTEQCSEKYRAAFYREFMPVISALMSALGQKQTYAPQKVMSALPPKATTKADMQQRVMSVLPPKADMCSARCHVCFGPKADIDWRCPRTGNGSKLSGISTAA
jgi:hypothetical protein